MAPTGSTLASVSDAGWTAIAALGAAALTAFASLGVVWVQGRLSAKARAEADLLRALEELMSRSVSIGTRSLALGQAMRFRSGLNEGLDIALRLRKPADVLELHDWMHQDLAPMQHALVEVWSTADQSLIAAANHLMDASVDVVTTSTAREQLESRRLRVRRYLLGERWTPYMRTASEEAVRAMAEARRDLLNLTRERLQSEAVNVFTGGMSTVT
jgi:hypothetical protein